MLNSIKKYFKKAKEEATREYSLETISDESYEIDKTKPWTGVDLDGTLAYYERSASSDMIGEPVPAMMAFVKKMIKHGTRVKIFTARVQDPEQLPIIRNWLKENGLPEIEITNVKDYYMHRIYDDRCIQVEENTGRLITD
ncbi:MAG: hypothetical protein PF690_10740 [Deltaproteobacteria bacterium]|jgi:hypothetical protein|nr:hypothetical protein [Deltaproteobacteria bacterium]